MVFRTVQKFIVVAILSVLVCSLQAQSVKELEKQRNKTLQLLESTSKMLNETKKSQRSSLNKLTIINKNIVKYENESYYSKKAIDIFLDSAFFIFKIFRV